MSDRYRVRLGEWLLNRACFLLSLAGRVNGVCYEVRLRRD